VLQAKRDGSPDDDLFRALSSDVEIDWLEER
jgi:hypothetical protein